MPLLLYLASRCRQSNSPFETRGRPSGSKRWRSGGLRVGCWTPLPKRWRIVSSHGASGEVGALLRGEHHHESRPLPTVKVASQRVRIHVCILREAMLGDRSCRITSRLAGSGRDGTPEAKLHATIFLPRRSSGLVL